MERMDDLPDADVMGPFLRDFEFERRESQGWRRWVRPLVWSVSRVRACERARILGTDSEAPWDTTRARIE